MTSARLEAVRVLLRLERGGTTLAAEVDRARAEIADPRDRGLLLELCSGTLRWRNALDAVVQHAARRHVNTLDPPVRAVLRLGAYQLRHLDRIPDHAVVDESVQVVKAIGADRSAGFVNGVLRALARAPGAYRLPPRPGAGAPRSEQLAYLTVTLSHPEWLAGRWLDRHGFEAADAWCQFNNTSPALTARPRREPELGIGAMMDALTEAGIAVSPGSFVTDTVRLPPGSLGRLPAALKLDLMVQDEGSQLVALGVGAQPGDRGLDVCAAPGGKTVLIARRLAPTGVLVAGDRRMKRLALLKATLEGAGLSVPVLAVDVRHPLPFGQVFDRVLLDAPCSGLGTLSRDPDLKWSRTEADIAAYATAQRAMLLAAADVVRPGGRLVYATCSSEPEENEEVADAFLADHPEFVQARIDFPPVVARQAELLDAKGRLVTRPPDHGLDAFFAVALARRQAP